MSLKQKTIRGLSWAFVDRVFTQALKFVIGIVLARLLSPQEFGLTGMLAIFITISEAFVVSGFSEALIRKTDVTDEDYSTVFLYNVVISFLCYAVVALSAGQIAVFFGEPILEDLILVLALAIIFNGFGVVSRAILIKKLDFKSHAKVSFFSNLTSGVVAITLAVSGFGVWSLVWKTVTEALVRAGLFSFFAERRYALHFNRESFRELFGFGSRLLLTELLNTSFNNVYNIIIGKFFSARELGLYVKADGYKNLPSRSLNKTIAVVSYPALAELKNEPEKLKRAYRKLIESTMYITFVLMFSLVAASENFIIGLIGPQWKEAVPFLQLLCFVGMFYPLHSLNMNMLKVKGRSDLVLKLSVYAKLFTVPVVVIGIFFGIKVLIVSMIFSSTVAYYLYSFYSGKMIGYSMKDQVLDIVPSFLFGALIGSLVYLTGKALVLPHLSLFLVQTAVGFLAAFSLSNLFHIRPFLEIKGIALKQLAKFKLFPK